MEKESDAQPYIPGMVEEMKEKGFAYVDQGALVVDVKEENDTKEIPPCMLLKSDGASLYTTTDLATIVERMKLFNPDEILYVVDKTSGTSLYPGIPLCKKDRYRTGYDRTQVHRFWYHERQGRQTLQDQTGRCHASGESDQGYTG